jgi:septal ring factor EnvC (AmiA/AmiB activator)
MNIRRAGVSLGIICAILGLTAGLPWFAPQPVEAARQTLQQQEAALQAQATADAKAAAAKKAQADAAAAKVAEISGQISSIQAASQETVSKISDTQTQIDTQNQQLAGMESDLRKMTDQSDALIREMYEMAVTSDPTLDFFSDKSVSEQQRRQAQLAALADAVRAAATRVTVAKSAATAVRDTLVAKNTNLTRLKQQQDDQKQSLADYQSVQQALKVNATAAMNQLNAQALAAATKANEVEKQISSQIASAIKSHSSGTGQCVKAGDYVGGMGSTGFSTGAHVHTELQVGGVPQNPRNYFGSVLQRWPLDNPIFMQEFGMTSFARAGAYGGGIHTGIDVTASSGTGTPVYAPADGCVILKQWYGGYGNAWAEQLSNGMVILLGHLAHY